MVFRITKLVYPRSQERGSLLVEFAVTVPVLIIFAAGIVHLGTALSKMSSLSHTSYLAARFMDGEGGVNPEQIEQLKGYFDRNQLGSDLIQEFEVNRWSDSNGTPDPNDDRIVVQSAARLKNLWSSDYAIRIGAMVTGPMYRNDQNAQVAQCDPSLPTYDSVNCAFPNRDCNGGLISRDQAITYSEGVALTLERHCASFHPMFGIPNET